VASRTRGHGEEQAHAHANGRARESASPSARTGRIPRFRRLAIPLLAIAVGALVMLVLERTAPEPERAPPEIPGAAVEVVRVESGPADATLEVHGTVVPEHRVAVRPQVLGEVAWVSPRLIPGGRFEAGEVLARIEDREYRLALRARRAETVDARTALALERSRAEVAEHEWETLGPEFAEAPREPEPGDRGRALALREPQVEAAEAAVDAAQSQRQRAALDLERTALRAPFRSVVASQEIDEGDVVGPESVVAELVAIDRFWVEVSVPVEALGQLEVPGIDPVERGSEVVVTHQAGDATIVREGYVLRALPELEEEGTLAQLLLAIEDPLEGEGDDATGPPLFLGAYVEAEIRARPFEDVVRIPPRALRGRDEVWVLTEAGSLDIRSVRVAWQREEEVLVAEGLAGGERVVVSDLPDPVDGMELRPVETEATETPPPEAP
jgi:RND family efflux transporter MFP subunit